MQVKAITVNAAGLAAERGIQGNGVSGVNQVKTETSNMFGPECRVTISQKGRSLSRQQTVQAETDAGNSQSVRGERKLLRQQEQMRLSKEIRDSCRENLNEIEKQIEGYNTSYAGFDRSKVSSANLAMINETVEEREKLKAALEDQKQLQAEESQRLAAEARQMAMQSAGYQDEIDNNNRELATLLKTMEETEKAEEQREGGEGLEAGGDAGASSAGNSVGDVIKNSTAHFMSSSMNREWRVEEMMDNLEASGSWYVDTADSITRSVLQKCADIKAALDDPEAFTDEQITEMMEDFQSGIGKSLEDVRDFRSLGLEVLRDTRDIRLQHMANSPLRDLQRTKDGMAQSAAAAALGEARQGRLDEASQALAEEVKDLIDQRNDVDRTLTEDEEEKEEQLQEEEQIKEEQVREGQINAAQPQGEKDMEEQAVIF